MATTQNQPTIRRGTTPDIVINTHSDLSGMKVELTIASGEYQIVHTTDDKLVVITEDVPDEPAADGEEPTTHKESKLHTQLTQEETLALKPNSKISVQVRCYSGGDATASNIVTVAVEDILRNGKIS